MNYCSIEDAWGKNNYISDQLDNHKEKVCKSKKEDFTNQPNIHINYSDDVCSRNVIGNTGTGCSDFINHIKSCRECHGRLRNYFRPRLVEKFEDIIEDNKDTLLLVLVGIFILLFFNLISSLNKD